MMKAMDRREAGAVIYLWTSIMHTLTIYIHGRVEQSLGFSPVRQKKEVYYSRQGFSLSCLGLGPQFRIFYFVFPFFC